MTGVIQKLNGTRRIATLVIGAICTALAVGLPSPAAQAEEYVQYGSNNPTGSGSAKAIGSTIDVSEVFSANYTYPTARFYWPGVVFANGIFFQVGFQDSGDTTGCQTLEYFAWAFDGAGNPFLSHTQDCVAVAPHYFTLTNVGSAGNGKYNWQARVGSTDVGTPIQAASTFPLTGVFGVAEVSTTGSWSSNPRISTARFDPAIRLLYPDGTWHSQTAAKVYRADTGVFSTPCPPYRVGSGSPNTMVTSDSGATTCKPSGAPLW